MIDYNKKQPIIELYKAVQSEGSLAGIPHLVLRTTGCTHRCWFGEGGWCDSWYTSIHPEKGKFSLNEVAEFFKENYEINHLMFTGGSPTMNAELCNEIVSLFKSVHINILQEGIVTIETEGSHYVETTDRIDLISISPKFSNTVPKLGIMTPNGKIVDQKFIDQHNKFRLNKDNIRKMIKYHKDYHFKPVCNPIEQPEVWAEIEEFRNELNIPKSKTWIMPPGDSRAEILRTLPMVINFCSENGYCFSGRDHILAFGDKREV